MKKSVIRRGVENRESVVAKFNLVGEKPKAKYHTIGGIPHKLVGNTWTPLTKVVK